MARGLPAVWSTIIGGVFCLTGLYLYTGTNRYPILFGLPFLLFGAFIILLGVYIHFVTAPDPPTMRDGEEIIDTRSPTQKVAIVKIAVGFPFVLMAIYLMYFTRQPYVYPTGSLFIGLYGLSSGLITYWKNTLTTYYVTTIRVVKAYRFVSLVQREVPLKKVRGVEERQSFIESFVGLGNIRVASGGGSGTLEIVVRNIENSRDFADKVRNLL
jgi:hypothetical protein